MIKVKSNLFNWSRYTDYADIKILKKDTVLFQQGDKANGFYYLQNGNVIISILREDGYERIIDFVFPGSLIGEQMINNTTSFTTAKLHADSILYFFSRGQFEELCLVHPEVSQEFGNSLIQKVRLLAKINSVLNAPIDVQLAFFLLNLHEKKGNETIEVNQITISNYIGKSRVAVWKVLKEWRNDEIIDINNQSFVIKDIEKLRGKMKIA